MLHPKDYDRWLTPYVKEDPSTVPFELVRTYPAEGMKPWRVAPLKGNGPHLLDPVTIPAESSTLFALEDPPG